MKIAVLCGGLSNERDVSISTGTGVAKALREQGHLVALLDLYLGCAEAEDINSLFTGDAKAARAEIGETSPDLAQVRAMRPDSDCLIGPNVLEACKAADLVFLALHGEEGENGKVQAFLDVHGIRYTGSGYLGSAIAMNKGISKLMLKSAGIPTPEGITLCRGDTPYRNIGFPCVVKPCSGGSSVGTSIVENEADYLAALELAFRYEAQVLVETYIRGRELTVGVLDGRAMPVIEIIPKTGFYDYRNKYQAGATLEVCPAEIGAAATERVQRRAEQVMAALQVEAYCRCDFLWDTAKDEFFCLEANTLPGMTPTSLIPQMAAAQGMDYGELCEKIIEVSQKKYVK